MGIHSARGLEGEQDRQSEVWRRGPCSSSSCIEAAFLEGRVWVRNSRDLHGDEISFSPQQWDRLLEQVAQGQATAGTPAPVIQAGDGVLLRNPVGPAGAAVRGTEQEWDAFVAGVRAGVFDFNSPSLS